MVTVRPADDRPLTALLSINRCFHLMRYPRFSMEWINIRLRWGLHNWTCDCFCLASPSLFEQSTQAEVDRERCGQTNFVSFKSNSRLSLMEIENGKGDRNHHVISFAESALTTTFSSGELRVFRTRLDAQITKHRTTLAVYFSAGRRRWRSEHHISRCCSFSLAAAMQTAPCSIFTFGNFLFCRCAAPISAFPHLSPFQLETSQGERYAGLSSVGAFLHCPSHCLTYWFFSRIKHSKIGK